MKYKLALILFVSLFLNISIAKAQEYTQQEIHYKNLVVNGFESWANGTGSIFDLLDENVTWIISGTAPLSKTYHSKKQLMDEVITPLNQRLSKKIVPTVRTAYVDGNTVIVIWDGKAATLSGESYNMSYAWVMEFDGDKIVKVTAFLDTLDFKEVMEKQF